MKIFKAFLIGLPVCVLSAGMYLVAQKEAPPEIETLATTTEKPNATTPNSEKAAETNAPASTAVNTLQNTVEPVPEVNATPPSPWISRGTSALSAELYDFIETAEVGYVDISGYPFDDFTHQNLKQLAQSGATLIFDNTQAYRLEGIEEQPADIIADYFGASSEGDAVVATSQVSPDGSVRYMVLPLTSPGDVDSLAEDIKTAVALLEEEKAKQSDEPEPRP